MRVTPHITYGKKRDLFYMKFFSVNHVTSIYDLAGTKSSSGDIEAITPHLDRLKAEGVKELGVEYLPLAKPPVPFFDESYFKRIHELASERGIKLVPLEEGRYGKALFHIRGMLDFCFEEKYKKISVKILTFLFRGQSSLDRLEIGRLRDLVDTERSFFDRRRLEDFTTNMSLIRRIRSFNRAKRVTRLIANKLPIFKRALRPFTK